jgi:hypothetical protein
MTYHPLIDVDEIRTKFKALVQHCTQKYGEHNFTFDFAPTFLQFAKLDSFRALDLDRMAENLGLRLYGAAAAKTQG